jgi:hypothetical protein
MAERRKQSDDTSAAPHCVVMSEIPGGGVSVKIEPPILEGETFERDFPNHRAARGYAGGIRMTRGYPIRDLTSLADGGKS